MRVVATSLRGPHTAHAMHVCTDDVTDEALMTAYARGDARAFDALYARHRSGVYRYVLRHCRNAASADELFQDVWMNLIRARATYVPAARFATWLYTLAHHRIVDHWRATGQVLVTSTDTDDDAIGAMNDIIAARTDEPEQRASNRQLAERLDAAIAELPPRQRDAFLLQQLSGLSLDEIAALTGAGVETIKSRLRYATGKLRAALLEVRADATDGR